MSSWTTLSFISKSDEIKASMRKPILDAFFSDLELPVTLHLEEIKPLDNTRDAVLETYGGKPLGQNSNVIETVAGAGPLLSAWGDSRIKQIYLPRARGVYGTELYQKLDNVVDSLGGVYHVWGQSILLKESLIVGVSDLVDDPVELNCCFEISLHSQDSIPSWFDIRQIILNNESVLAMKNWLSGLVDDIEVIAVTS